MGRASGGHGSSTCRGRGGWRVGAPGPPPPRPVTEQPVFSAEPSLPVGWPCEPGVLGLSAGACPDSPLLRGSPGVARMAWKGQVGPGGTVPTAGIPRALTVRQAQGPLLSGSRDPSQLLRMELLIPADRWQNGGSGGEGDLRQAHSGWRWEGLTQSLSPWPTHCTAPPGGFELPAKLWLKTEPLPALGPSFPVSLLQGRKGEDAVPAVTTLGPGISPSLCHSHRSTPRAAGLGTRHQTADPGSCRRCRVGGLLRTLSLSLASAGPTVASALMLKPAQG